MKTPSYRKYNAFICWDKYCHLWEVQAQQPEVEPIYRELYEQTNGVAMGSPLGPLLANVFMCHIENQVEQKNMIPSFYRRYVDDTLVKMPNAESATDFLQVLNSVHPSLSFTMELEHEGSIPFLGTLITRWGNTQKKKQKCKENQLTRDFCFIFKATLITGTKKA